MLWSDPFVRIFPPAIEGRDLNPMLQHPGLIFHPPLLYLGYGGFDGSGERGAGEFTARRV
ncbi:cytochrome c biogenesis protein CcsA [Escherichia coli]